MKQKLSDNFYLEEMVASDYALRNGLDNTPSPTTLERLQQTALQLEKVRELLGNNAIRINSGYRSPTLNRAIGGSATSAHCLGYAVDFVCDGFGSPYEIVKALKDALPYDQLIYEHTWVHISFDPKGRQQTLTAVFQKGEKTTYKLFE